MEFNYVHYAPYFNFKNYEPPSFKYRKTSFERILNKNKEIGKCGLKIVILREFKILDVMCKF